MSLAQCLAHSRPLVNADDYYLKTEQAASPGEAPEAGQWCPPAGDCTVLVCMGLGISRSPFKCRPHDDALFVLSSFFILSLCMGISRANPDMVNDLSHLFTNVPYPRS